MRLKLASQPESIQKIDKIVRSIMEAHNIPFHRYGDILIAITEAVNNAIEHGNQRNHKKSVFLETKVISNMISITIEDQGDGFYLSTVKNPTNSECIEKTGGRGIYLMKNLTDVLTYSDDGRCVEMRFFIYKENHEEGY